MAYKQTTKQSSDTGSQLELESRSRMPLLKINFILMAVAGALIVLGFCLMAGGATGWDSFNADIFSTRRVVVGPTISFIGFIFMGFAIMYSPKSKSENEQK